MMLGDKSGYRSLTTGTCAVPRGRRVENLVCVCLLGGVNITGNQGGMNNTFVVAGLASPLAAIVGGGLKAFGIEVPLLKSLFRQIVLGVVGIVLLAFGLGAVSLPKRPSMPTPEVTAFSHSHSIGPGQGTSIHVRAMTGGICVQGAIATIRDNSGGRFLPSNTTTVSGMLGDGC